MKKVRFIRYILISCLCVLLLSVCSDRVVAEESNEVTFTLTYPDGSTETVNNREEAIVKLNEWKLLYEGETDPSGIIKLQDWAKKGEIKIVEKEIPAGYTAETTEMIVDLTDEEATIINKKIEEPKPERYNLPKTGIDSYVRQFTIVAAVITYISLKKKQGQ